MQKENKTINEDKNMIIKKVRRVVFEELIDGKYVIFLITRRNYNRYIYERDTNYVKRASKERLKYYLDNKPLQMIKNEIDRVDQFINNNFSENRTFTVDEVPATIKYKAIDHFAYDFVLFFTKIINEKPVNTVKIFEHTHLFEILHNLSTSFSIFGRIKSNPFAEQKNNSDTIESNPLYINAIKNDDLVLMSMIKMFYHCDTIKDCKLISKVTKLKMLPSLSEKYDKPFYVKTSTINCNLLLDSGYKILHRPYFAMMNSTHACCTLNPHRKSGVDAGPVDCDVITFDEYLLLFKNLDE